MRVGPTGRPHVRCKARHDAAVRNTHLLPFYYRAGELPPTDTASLLLLAACNALTVVNADAIAATQSEIGLLTDFDAGTVVKPH